jgi:hypothetical protein
MSQLSEPSGQENNGWSAGAWLGITKDDQRVWQDETGPIDSVPW